MQAIEYEQDEDVLGQAVFAVSQLPDEAATQLLLELAMDPSRSREIRRQALFWLANSDDDEAIVALVKLLSQ
jgi:HEAT repeat protein